MEVEALGEGKRTYLAGLRSNMILRTLGKMAGVEVVLIWSLMLEKMPLSASQLGRRPPAFRSAGAQVRKQLSGPVGWALFRLLATGWETTLLICKASSGALPACLSAVGWSVVGMSFRMVTLWEMGMGAGSMVNS